MRQVFDKLQGCSAIAIGDNDNGQCNTDNWYSVCSVICGYNYTIGLKKNGTAVVAGENLPWLSEVEQWTASLPSVPIPLTCAHALQG